ncbi:putative 2-aminoethylphosphonate ABC transporter ATP-binding protein [Acidovorax sp.]|uniref:putative 2-aminoethylphosphonate ABC transporter ATP-binding protein n=1 Tax=Acidovorax sp. TaxID=1872122 RepID=UPI00403847A4
MSIEIRNVSKQFRDFQALRDVSLDIASGELIALLGPSGCGKTTLLRIIAGLETQTSGRIVQNDRDISWLPPVKRDYGIVFQSYALFPNLTIAENVAYGLVNRKKSKAEISARVAELLQLVGLPTSGEKYPAQLSGGQQQRIALARALATSPRLLLLDEPLSALDALERIRLRGEIRRLQQKLGVTTIMVTHDQEEALTMADRIVVMNQGVIEQVGTPEEIYGMPASPFVADFVGTMNFLPGVAAAQGRVRLGGVELATEDGVPAVAPGGTVTVCIRPEDVVTRNVTAGTPNAIQATVAELEFLGSFYRATLRSTGPSPTLFRADYSINAMRDLKVRKGGATTVALPVDRIRVYRDVFVSAEQAS